MRHLIAKLFPLLYYVLSEKQYLKLRYFLQMGKTLDLKNPKTMNEKLQWLKLYDRQPEYTTMVDKILAKDYVAQMIGKEYIIPTLGIWNHFDEINFDNLPNQFVLKTNHSGGSTGVVICSDKNDFDKVAAKRQLEKSLKQDLYKSHLEWPYKNISRKIFAESYLGDDVTDYKFYCFNGTADVVLLCTERSSGQPKFYFFDKEWNLRRLNKRGKEAPVGFTLPKPQGIDKMFEIADKLSNGIPFARIDLYNIDGKIFFGEITLYPASGYDVNRLPEADLYFGDKMLLTNNF